MENTALYQDKVDHFSQGHGLLQVKMIKYKQKIFIVLINKLTNCLLFIFQHHIILQLSILCTLYLLYTYTYILNSNYK